MHLNCGGMPHAHLFQDHRCYSSNPNQQTDKAKIQYVIAAIEQF